MTEHVKDEHKFLTDDIFDGTLLSILTTLKDIGQDIYEKHNIPPDQVKATLSYGDGYFDFWLKYEVPMTPEEIETKKMLLANTKKQQLQWYKNQIDLYKSKLEEFAMEDEE